MRAYANQQGTFKKYSTRNGVATKFVCEHTAKTGVAFRNCAGETHNIPACMFPTRPGNWVLQFASSSLQLCRDGNFWLIQAEFSKA